MDKNTFRNPRLGVVGGQAVLEGVMMRHKDKYSDSVRREDRSIDTENREFVSLRKNISFSIFRLYAELSILLKCLC